MGLNIFLFVVGLVMLIKGGDWFVDSASGIARKFHLPELLIGATVVSIGTTLPEVMVSAQGALSGAGDIAFGNAIGSIICNTALVSAVTIAIKPGKVARKPMLLPVAFFFLAAIFYSVIAYTTGVFERWVGAVLLLIFAVYVALTLWSVRRQPTDGATVQAAATDASEEVTEETETSHPIRVFLVEAVTVFAGGALMLYKGGAMKWFGCITMATFVVYAVLCLFGLRRKSAVPSLVKNLLFLVIGAAIIAGGANLLVDSGTFIAEALGIPQAVIALTFVALGTSLPELVTAITSLMKGHGALSLGNVIGANLLNLVLVCGVSGVIAPFSVPSEQTIGGIPSSLVIDIPVMLGVMCLMVVPTMLRGKLSRVQGILLLCIYAGFCTLQFVL